MPSLFRRLLFFFLVLMITSTSHAQMDTLLVSDLTTSWIIYQPDDGVQQVFDSDGRSVGSFFLTPSMISEHTLRLCGEDYGVWLDGSLIKYQHSGCEYLHLEKYRESPQDTFYITLVTPDLSFMQADLLKFRQKPEIVTAPIARKSSQKAASTVFTMLVGFLIMMSLVRAVDESTFQDMIKLVAFRRKLNFNDAPVFSLPNFSLVLLVAFVIGFQQIHHQVNSNLNPWSILGGELGVLLLFFIGKALLTIWIAKLFQFQKIVGAHLREYFLWMSLFVSVILLFQLSLFWLRGFGWDSIFQANRIILIVALIFTVWIYFRLPKTLAKRKLHIISYLCTTEILPTFVLANWLLH